jgi:LmbE family N-acetylglucosaminyl deacetylase
MKRLYYMLMATILPVVGFAQVLIVAPHPDDEVLGAAETIQKKLAEGEEVYILYITDGEAHVKENPKANEDYANQRKRESIKAVSTMGVEKNNLYFLGFPDSYLSQLSYEKIISSYSKSSKTNSWAKFVNLDFTKTNLRKSIAKVMKEVQPTEVYYTSVTDTHPDHATTGQIMRDLLKHFNAVGYEYTIHKSLGQADRWKGYDPYPKLDYIRMYNSQFHTGSHRYYLETFAYFPERFQIYAPRF